MGSFSLLVHVCLLCTLVTLGFQTVFHKLKKSRLKAWRIIYNTYKNMFYKQTILCACTQLDRAAVNTVSLCDAAVLFLHL